MRISDWSSDVCSSDLRDAVALGARAQPVRHRAADEPRRRRDRARDRLPRDGRLHDRHRRRRASRCAESGVRLMAEDFGEKTEAPTPKRKRDSAKEGNILKSREFATALVVLAGCGWMMFFGGALLDACKALMAASFQFGRSDE